MQLSIAFFNVKFVHAMSFIIHSFPILFKQYFAFYSYKVLSSWFYFLKHKT